MKIEIFGASTSAKRSHAGNSYAGSGVLTLDREGGYVPPITGEGYGGINGGVYNKKDPRGGRGS